jgi:hypothetical protein
MPSARLSLSGPSAGLQLCDSLRPMGVVRLHLHLIAIVTVVAQLAMPALASAALCCNLPQQAAAESHAMSDCCAEDGAHACALKNRQGDGHHAESHDAEHQGESHHSADGTFRPACQLDQQIFELLLGTTAVMPPPTSVAPPAFAMTTTDRPTTGRPLWTSTADLPPPKA